jgi:hypothetical protein
MIKSDIFDAIVIPENLSEEDKQKLREFEWKPTRSYTGQKCYLTGETIGMFDKAFKGTAILREYRFSDNHVYVVRWATEKAIMFHRLKGDIT